MRSFFLNPLTPSSRNPFLLLLTLSLLSSFTSLAWDDEDIESKPFHQSRIQNQESRIAPTSAIDYGYKNTYQANPSRRTSVFDYGGPKRLSQEDDTTAPI